MTKFISILTAIAVAGMASAAIAAEAKKCKEGYIYNPETKKCVLKRGS